MIHLPGPLLVVSPSATKWRQGTGPPEAVFDWSGSIVAFHSSIIIFAGSASASLECSETVANRNVEYICPPQC